MTIKSLLDSWEGKSKELLHQNIEEVLRSYRHSWDVFSELLQNSVDACIRKYDSLLENERNSYNPEIYIEIDSQNNTIVVQDNGEGIPHDKLNDIIIPGGTLKKLGNTYGYKGYGLTFLAFISKEIEIKTARNGSEYTIKFNNLFDWVIKPQNDEYLKPTFFEKTRETQDTYTIVKLVLPIGSFEEKFPVLSTLDSIFKWSTNKKVLEFVLRTRTTVGNTRKIFCKNVKPEIKFNINIDGKEFEIPYEFLEPLESSYMKAGKVYEFFDYIDKIYCEPRYADKTYRGLYKIDKNLEIGTRKRVYFDCKILICGRTATSKLNEEFELPSLYKSINEKFDISTGVYLSIDGLPTGIRIDNWDKKGASWQRYYVIVDVLDKTFSEQLDSGRKGISGYFASKLVEKIEYIITKMKENRACVENITLQRLSKYLHTTEDVEEFLEENADFDIEALTERWKNATQINFPLKSINREPLDENAVIVIFYELLIRNIIKGYKTIFISSQAKYDVAFEYFFDNVKPEDIYNNETNKLGLNPSLEGRRIPIKRLVGEFKIRLEDLLNDFDKGVKNVDDLNIAIVWNFDKEKIEELEGLIEEINPYSRKYYGVTHELHYKNRTLPIISLKHIFNIL
ncbi:sensor histidine kinase [Persephonella atlantica]|uniref:Sensor histidine kinase n=1 Tax=Persephonella atlantica TaxID=2699429 RepID=A0ABS1GJR2_9AQUI|nr:ATP-binding protein [Persephonella atlantica]MBK3333125.1 sensor histidine kinase [Persephonella atlantica]